jgi:hypothetical protein
MHFYDGEPSARPQASGSTHIFVSGDKANMLTVREEEERSDTPPSDSSCP